MQITPLVQRQPEEEAKPHEGEEVVQEKRLDSPFAQRREDEEETEEAAEPMQAKPVSDQVTPLMQRQAEEEKEEEEKPEMVQTMPADSPAAQRQEEEKEEEKEPLQTKGGRGTTPALSRDQEFLLRHQSGHGSALPEPSRAFLEPRFGHDFGQVRIHADNQTADIAHGINARAFTHGRDIYFGAGRYQPHTEEGQRLLAHELTHVAQQGFAAPRAATAVQRQEEAEGAYEESVFEPTETEIETEIEGEEKGEQVEKIGVVEHDEGANLWPEPDPERKKPKLGLLPLNTRVFIDRNVGDGWYSVYVEGHQRGEALPVAAGTHGYVAAARINLDMPDPDAWFFKITKEGQGALEVAGEVYKDNFKASWGKDYRYLVNVLVTVNEAKNRKHIYKEKPDDAWDEAKTRKGGKIWVPGLELVNALHGQISSGSISYEILTTLADIAIGIAAFIVGILHGALMSIADIFIGAYDLIKMGGELIVKLFKGTLISDAKAFFEEISKIKMEDIIEMVGAKWNAPDVWDRWKFRGYVIGYAIVEILLLYFSVGIVTAVKWAGKVGKVGKLAEYLSKLPKVQKVIEAAKALKGKGMEEMRAALKAAHALSEAHGWAARVLRIPMSMLRRLSEVDIGKLKKLPQWARERFANLSLKVKLFVCGCASPCNVDFRKIEQYLQELAAKGAKGAKKLSSVDDVLAALPAGVKKSKIAKKLRIKESAIMSAIKEAELTNADFGKLADFLTPGDLANQAQAYRTFVRYLTGVVPSKTGKDIKKLNEILEKIVKAEPRRGAAIKGAMFEQWVALHVPELSSRTFSRITFDLKKLFKKKLPPYNRTVDKWVPDKGEIWDMKHQLSKVPTEQVADYAEIIGKAAPDGNIVKSVNYLFPTKEAAELNKHLSTTYKFSVYYIDEATNALTKLL